MICFSKRRFWPLNEFLKGYQLQHIVLHGSNRWVLPGENSCQTRHELTFSFCYSVGNFREKEKFLKCTFLTIAKTLKSEIKHNSQCEQFYLFVVVVVYEFHKHHLFDCSPKFFYFQHWCNQYHKNKNINIRFRNLLAFYILNIQKGESFSSPPPPPSLFDQEIWKPSNGDKITFLSVVQSSDYPKHFYYRN